MRGVKSEAMVMCATSPDGATVEFLRPPPGSKPGDRVYFEGFEGLLAWRSCPDSPANPPRAAAAGRTERSAWEFGLPWALGGGLRHPGRRLEPQEEGPPLSCVRPLARPPRAANSWRLLEAITCGRRGPARRFSRRCSPTLRRRTTAWRRGRASPSGRPWASSPPRRS